MLEKLKTGEIIEDYKWGINSIDALEIYICPIMEGMKPLILHQYLQLIGGIKHVKKDFFRGDDTNAN